MLKEKEKVTERDWVIQLGLSISSHLELEECLDTIIREIARIYNAEGASIILVDEEMGNWTYIFLLLPLF